MHANACADYHHIITSGKNMSAGAKKIILPSAPKSLKMALHSPSIVTILMLLEATFIAYSTAV
jgi:hypothetical protein